MPGWYSTLLDRARPDWMKRPPNKGFDIPTHYDLMVELDRDVHDNQELSRSEVAYALSLIGYVPKTVFLPCVGTGRHIRPLLEAGVQRIVGVDVSNASIIKARESLEDDARVELIVADLLKFSSREMFDAVLLLGNSFGDLIDKTKLQHFVCRLIWCLKDKGALVMDYIGEGYLGRCYPPTPTTWELEFQGKPASDTRTPSFDLLKRVMSIEAVVCDPDTGERMAQTRYLKLVLTPDEVIKMFGWIYVYLKPMGLAKEKVGYYRDQNTQLGMLACSTWWVGQRRFPPDRPPYLPLPW